MSDFDNGDAKRIVTYRLYGISEQTVIMLSERFPDESDIPEILARINGVDVEQIRDVQIMD